MATSTSNSLLLNTSRYVQGGTSETQGKRIEWWERLVYPQDPSDLVYVVEDIYAGRLDNISAVFYGEPRYWWFIAQYNNILDPASEITPGRVLLIPTKDRFKLLMTGKMGGVASTRSPDPIIPPVVL